jgi:hypothetical protein
VKPVCCNHQARVHPDLAERCSPSTDGFASVRCCDPCRLNNMGEASELAYVHAAVRSRFHGQSGRVRATSVIFGPPADPTGVDEPELGTVGVVPPVVLASVFPASSADDFSHT